MKLMSLIISNFSILGWGFFCVCVFGGGFLCVCVFGFGFVSFLTGSVRLKWNSLHVITGLFIQQFPELMECCGISGLPVFCGVLERITAEKQIPFHRWSTEKWEGPTSVSSSQICYTGIILWLLDFERGAQSAHFKSWGSSCLSGCFRKAQLCFYLGFLFSTGICSKGRKSHSKWDPDKINFSE